MVSLKSMEKKMCLNLTYCVPNIMAVTDAMSSWWSVFKVEMWNSSMHPPWSVDADARGKAVLFSVKCDRRRCEVLLPIFGGSLRFVNVSEVFGQKLLIQHLFICNMTTRCLNTTFLFLVHPYMKCYLVQCIRLNKISLGSQQWPHHHKVCCTFWFDFHFKKNQKNPKTWKQWDPT